MYEYNCNSDAEVCVGGIPCQNSIYTDLCTSS